ncbi:sulfurtransferase [Loigolactobacillus backii]|uniref:Sulfurtransferase n=1 Tax=Loigolactobacillus backii TaxID=375175 RepID=A0A192H3E1_9LACO|nr:MULTISPECIES: rhodanese-like domain-containing protein [Loigolactobacillus]ANK59337.1 sulfurtransferase [Loigolactobacillus backii]ANK62752.1 sulfurtransferase [Loigolactobacillus backii]ANK64329.1 sulfurtransferase [Loigolactobacillus backii]ANK67275.1 sulfurtransferase [Loigolactobacillus backii]ANK70240.1 sulfurtransferase [Loigolactobacillus backii]
MTLGAAISASFIFNVIIILFVVYWVGNQLYLYIQRRRVGKEITEEVFNKGMRKAQIVDLREPKDFDSGHILGARNLPYSQLTQRYTDLRADLPIYLYDQGRTLSTRAAIKLYRKGYRNLYWLKKGYQNWDGKTKSKKHV